MKTQNRTKNKIKTPTMKSQKLQKSQKKRKLPVLIILFSRFPLLPVQFPLPTSVSPLIHLPPHHHLDFLLHPIILFPLLSSHPLLFPLHIYYLGIRYLHFHLFVRFSSQAGKQLLFPPLFSLLISGSQ